MGFFPVSPKLEPGAAAAAATATDPDMVAREFLNHYYDIFDTKRDELSLFYREWSVMTYEGWLIQGSQEIAALLDDLPLDECKHKIAAVNGVLSDSSGSITIFVTGYLHLPDQDNPSTFCQMLHLIPTEEGDFYVYKDVFRFIHDWLHSPCSLAAAMDIKSLAKKFVTYYYTTFDAKRTELHTVYREWSTMVVEGQRFKGMQKIAAKLADVDFDNCQHKITTVDYQPFDTDGSFRVIVSGYFQLHGRPDNRFCQMFHLKPSPPEEGGFYLLTDIFHCIYERSQ